MAGTEGTTAEAKAEGGVSDEMAAEIEQAVEQVVVETKEANDAADEKAEEEAAPAKEIPKEGEEKPAKEGDEEPADQGEEKSEESGQEQQGEESPGDAEGDEESPEAEARADELLTRAVRAGIDLKDARTFVTQDADALERQIGLLEKAGQQGKDQAGEGDESGAEGDATDEDPLAGIPDLNPEVYDESIVAGFKAMKSIISKQNETIKGLTAGGERTWFDSKVEGLKVKNLDTAKRSELSNEFESLKAGYAAKGQEVDDATVFQKATKLVLGDDIKAAAEADKAVKLKRREAMQTVPPSGPTAKATGDPLDEVAEEVDRKYFNKK